MEYLWLLRFSDTFLSNADAWTATCLQVIEKALMDYPLWCNWPRGSEESRGSSWYICTGMAWETCPRTPQLHRPRFMSYKKSKLVLLSSNLCSRGESLSLSATARNCWKLRVLRIAVLGLRKFQTTLVATSRYVKHANVLSISINKTFPLFFHIRNFLVKILVVMTS